jgi:quaternary ammonium compound-resistance protein SugE
MVASGGLLLIALKSIPIGTAYAVWTGIGAVGAFALGIFLFAEPATLLRFVFVGMIVLGIVGLKMVSGN